MEFFFFYIAVNDSRVVLRGDEKNDYINASFVDVSVFTEIFFHPRFWVKLNLLRARNKSRLAVLDK